MATRTDPYRGFRFLVDINGIQFGFQECSGLDSQAGVIDYREGPDAPHLRKLAGLSSFSPLSLKRGITDSADMYQWHLTALTGTPDRRQVSIILLDFTSTVEKIRWNVTDAWISKWTGPAFNATSNAVAIESLEITHEGVKRA